MKTYELVSGKVYEEVVVVHVIFYSVDAGLSDKSILMDFKKEDHDDIKKIIEAARSGK